MTTWPTSKLGQLIEAERLTQAEVARGIGRSEALVSKLIKGSTGASQETINALLAFLSDKLARPVTYEELFGAPDTTPVVEGVPEPEPSR